MPFEKGKSGNPGGLSKEQRKARDELRSALARDAKRVHRALLRLIKADNSQAVVYAHQLLHGKEADAVTVDLGGSVEFNYSKLSTSELRMLKGLLETASVPQDGDPTTH